jgi:excisionase family DNA binding protein
MTAAEPRPDLTAEQAADRLGVSVRTLNRWQAEGLLTPATPPGKRRRFAAADVDALAVAPPPA